jgi:predicted lipoprotein with Yx(FWY)xxD motif
MQRMRYRTSRGEERVSRAAITRIAGMVALAVALGMIGFLAAGSVARSATQSNATVSLRKTNLGMILVNARGHTLYLFAKDRNAKSACTGSCARFWPPLLSRGKATAGPGVKKSLLGTTRRSNGSLQVTYNKHPLYTYVVDKRAGQTNGEGNSLFGASGRRPAAPPLTPPRLPAPTHPARRHLDCPRSRSPRRNRRGERALRAAEVDSGETGQCRR